MTYKEEVQNLLMNPTRFETAWDLNKEFNNIVKEQVELFWKDVEHNLSSIIDSTKWTVKLTSMELTYPMLYLYLNNDENIIIAYQNLTEGTYWGVKCKTSNHKYPWEILFQKSKDDEKWKDIPRSEKTWPGWEYCRPDFSIKEDVKKIIDSDRKALIRDCANGLYDLATKFEDDIIEVLNLKKT